MKKKFLFMIPFITSAAVFDVASGAQQFAEVSTVPTVERELYSTREAMYAATSTEGCSTSRERCCNC